MAKNSIVWNIYKRHINLAHIIFTIFSLVFDVIYYETIEGLKSPLHYKIQGVLVSFLGLACIRRHKITCIIMSYERMILYFTSFIIPFYPLSSMIFIEGFIFYQIYIHFLNLVFIPIDYLSNSIFILIVSTFVVTNYIIMVVLLYLEIKYMLRISKR